MQGTFSLLPRRPFAPSSRSRLPLGMPHCISLSGLRLPFLHFPQLLRSAMMARFRKAMSLPLKNGKEFGQHGILSPFK